MPTIATVVGIGIALAGLGLTIPQALRPVWVVLMIVNYPIGWVVTHVVMAAHFLSRGHARRRYNEADRPRSDGAYLRSVGKDILETSSHRLQFVSLFSPVLRSSHRPLSETQTEL